MTEELEKKLNELLGMKKQLEEITEEKKKTATAAVFDRYKKQIRFSFTRFCVAVVTGGVMVVFGMIVFIHTHDVICIDSPTFIIAGLLLMFIAKICWLIRISKLSILQEMKEFELRITDMLKK